MYQIYSLPTIVVLLWGITIWASIPEVEEDRGHWQSDRQTGPRSPYHADLM